MLNNRNYYGVYSSQLTNYITEKRNLGYKYIEEERLSFEFDLLSTSFDCSRGLPLELLEKFIEPKPNWQATTQKRHISFIQNFARYLNNHDYDVILPKLVSLKNSNKISYKPYIFTHEEIYKILNAVDNIHPSSRNTHIFYPVIFRMLYCTGMRISEALNLRMQDVDIKNMTIHIINPKNKQDRLIPISKSLTKYCIWYISKIHPVYRDDDFFFLNNSKHKQYYRNNVQTYFTTVLEKLNFPLGGYKRTGPHLHCLRHTFCVHSLQKMLSKGIPQGVALQYLSAYMGHQSISATSRYLQLTAEAFPDLIDKMELEFSDIFPSLYDSEESNNE